MMQSLNLAENRRDGKILTSSQHQLIGEPKNIAALVEDLKKDKHTKHAELNAKTLFLVESAAKKPVSQFMKRTIFALKPVIIDLRGYEHWEIAAHQKEELMDFIKAVKPTMEEFELLSIKNTSLQNVYFPKVMPDLTDLQKKALELAVREGYYTVPKKTNLRALAKMMKISLATYQKHLQKAEGKIIPDVLSILE